MENQPEKNFLKIKRAFLVFFKRLFKKLLKYIQFEINFGWKSLMTLNEITTMFGQPKH